MAEHVSENSQPGALASMLEVGADAGRAWTEQELGAVLRHQLEAPLAFDLGAPASVATAGGIKTFRDLLHHPAPPVELLVMAKDFAKARRADPSASVPGEIAAVIYFAAIVVARSRCGRSITRLPPKELSAGVEWALGQPWVDGATRSLFR